MSKRRILPVLALFPVVFAGCGGEGGGDAAAAGEGMAEGAMTESAPAESGASQGQVRIVSPAEGETVEGSTVVVTLEAMGVEVVPAGDMTPGTGHHHLFLDADVSPADQPIPAVPGSIIHMGDASSSYTFEDVAPGEHRLIAVLADGAHVPLQPWVVDTVHFTVR